VRQDGSTVGGNEPVDAACVALCDPDTCGSSVCPNQKRDLSQLDSTGRFLVGNRSTEEWYPPIGGNDLRKRILEYPTRGGWTPLRTAQYLSGMITGLGTADTQFTPTNPELIYPVFGDSETTVSQEEALGATKLQVGNGGLHGCTELTVISKRYVYMVRREVRVYCS
jgi:hypothetical protein